MINDYNLTVVQTKSGNHVYGYYRRLRKEYKKDGSDTDCSVPVLLAASTGANIQVFIQIVSLGSEATVACRMCNYHFIIN